MENPRQSAKSAVENEPNSNGRRQLAPKGNTEVRSQKKMQNEPNLAPRSALEVIGNSIFEYMRVYNNETIVSYLHAGF
jgi:hypothetical protein